MSLDQQRDQAIVDALPAIISLSESLDDIADSLARLLDLLETPSLALPPPGGEDRPPVATSARQRLYDAAANWDRP